MHESLHHLPERRRLVIQLSVEGCRINNQTTALYEVFLSLPTLTYVNIPEIRRLASEMPHTCSLERDGVNGRPKQ